jgi:hypothetical protein
MRSAKMRRSNGSNDDRREHTRQDYRHLKTAPAEYLVCQNKDDSSPHSNLLVIWRLQLVFYNYIIFLHELRKLSLEVSSSCFYNHGRETTGAGAGAARGAGTTMVGAVQLTELRPMLTSIVGISVIVRTRQALITKFADQYSSLTAKAASRTVCRSGVLRMITTRLARGESVSLLWIEA